jgi:uncharacterized protein (TIGR00369 family)
MVENKGLSHSSSSHSFIYRSFDKLQAGLYVTPRQVQHEETAKMTDMGSKAVLVSHGEWANWQVWEPEPFEQSAGPFYSRAESASSVICAFRPAARHLNGSGSVHGGCLMTFADFALFAISESHWSGRSAVTVSATCDFLGRVRAGDLVQASGEVVRATKTMLFVRGVARVGPEPVLAFSGILKVFGAPAVSA